MNRPIRILSRLATAALSLALASGAHTAFAQQGYGQGYGQNQNYQNGNGGDGAVLPLPQGIRRVVGIDAQNVLLAEIEPETEGAPSEYRAIPVQHVYVGGIAKLFGGTTISTEEFVSPAYSKNQGQNGFNNQNRNQNGINPNGAPSFGYNNGGGYPNGGFLPNGNGFLPNGNGFLPNGYPNGYTNGVTGNFGGFSGASQVVPQVTYGVGNLMRSRNLPMQADGYNIQQSR